MRKYLIGFSIWIASIGNICFAQPISEQRAKTIATRFFYEHVNNSPENSVSRKKATGVPAQAQTWEQKGVNCMYAVNMPDSGWVLVSGDERTEPILAISESDTFPNKENMPPAMLGLLEDYMNEIQFIQDSCPNAEVHPNWLAIEQGGYTQSEQPQLYSSSSGGGYVVGTRLLNRPNRGEVIWNQQGHKDAEPDYVNDKSIYECDYAYNKFCPKWYLADKQCGTYAGCVAVAMGELMWYWQWPHTGYVHSSIDKNGNGKGSMELHIYDWSKMPKYLSGEYLGRPTPMDQVDMVAGFLRDCGYAAKMEYGQSGSGTDIQNTRDALENTFSYTVDDIKRKFWHTENKWGDLIRAEINAARPVIYFGTGSGGHAFVVDGYNNDNQFHINWGWGGTSNGWFHLDDLTPPGHNYNSEQKALFGIQPAPACGSANIDGGSNYRVGVAGAVTVSNQTVPSGTTAVYYSGTSVTLRPGFKATAGSHTHIAIQNFPCNGIAPASLDEPIALRSIYAEPVESTSGLAETTADGLSIAPNPTDGLLTMQCVQEIDRIELYDLNGEKAMESRETTLDLHPLPAGMYIIIVRFADGTIHSEKVVKQP